MKKILLSITLVSSMTLAGSTFAQPPNGPANAEVPMAVPVNPAGDLEQRVAELESRVSRFDSALERLRSEHRRDFATHQDAIDQNADDIRTIANNALEQGEAIRDVQRRLQDIAGRVDGYDGQVATGNGEVQDLRRIVQQQGQILERISTQQNSMGVYTPNLLGNSQYDRPAFRREVARAVQGRLLINNPDLSQERVIYVNGTPWRARIGQSYIWVPMGNVSVSQYPGITPQQFDNWQFNERTGNWELRYNL